MYIDMQYKIPVINWGKENLPLSTVPQEAFTPVSLRGRVILIDVANECGTIYTDEDFTVKLEELLEQTPEGLTIEGVRSLMIDVLDESVSLLDSDEPLSQRGYKTASRFSLADSGDDPSFLLYESVLYLSTEELKDFDLSKVKWESPTDEIVSGVPITGGWF